MIQTGLKDLTIIIPTYQRPEFVLRQHVYWRDSDAQVLILDGSPQAMYIPASLQAPNIRYLHSGMSFPERLSTAGRHITSKYCAMLGDDEFFAFSGLRAALQRMESDPSVLGCVGRCLYFFVDQGRFLMKDAYREWTPFSESATNQSARMDEDLPPNKTHMAHYAVMRSGEWARIMQDAYRQPFSCAYVYERLVNLQRALLGRTEILEDLLWFRSMENRNISINVAGSPDFLVWALDPKYASEVIHYRRIATDLLLKGGVSPDQVAEYEKRFVEVGVQRIVERKSKFSHRFRMKYQRGLLKWSPKRLRLFVKRTLPARFLSFSGWEGYGVERICESLVSRKTRFETSEILRIRDLALQTAENAERIG